ncbi:MAG: hypothetical protein PF503_11785 [Desulfobacula sp.]|jgi:hypothetical protein|nr:hypothetical protein [Desulfobacula sp.]
MSKEKTGFKEWAPNSANCCTGCDNNCRYCYAKQMAIRFNQVTEEEWANTRIRQKDVNKNWRKREGVIGFPTSHDILPSNIDECIIVLDKILTAGNEVVIVSKPRLNLMIKLSESIKKYQGQVLFRFTIGAMDNMKLLFWEPNAPIYEERKASLSYVKSIGFRTSVSIEPMIDPPATVELVNDLMPFVTEDIWIGTMNQTGRLKKGADDRLLREIHRIEAEQGTSRLIMLYQKLQDNQMVRWKDKARKKIEKGLNISIQIQK